MDLKLEIGGMHCDGCVRRVQNLLAKVPGVTVVEVQLGSAKIAANDPNAETGARATLERAGYTVAPSTQP
ncbi:MAG: heavy metal-associated domain-containing protein [Polyangiaceae bacterium]